MGRRKSIRRGFSLVESAIVLAVLGLIVAGIWVAASSFSTKRSAEQLFTSIMLFRERLARYLTVAVAEAGGPNWDQYLALGDVIGRNLTGIRWDTTENTFKTDFGEIGFWLDNDGSYPRLELFVHDIPLPACALIANRISGLMQKRTSNPVYVQFYDEPGGNVTGYFCLAGFTGCNLNDFYSSNPCTAATTLIRLNYRVER